MGRERKGFSKPKCNIYEGRKVSEHSPSLFNKYVCILYYVPHTVNEADLEKV